MSLLRKGILVSGGQVFGIALNMLAGILFSRTLGPDGMGQVDLFRSTANIVGVVFAMGLGPASIYLLNNRKVPLVAIVTNSVKVSVVLGAVLAAALAVTILRVPEYFGVVSAAVAIVFSVGVGAVLMTNLVRPVLVAQLDARRMVAVDLAAPTIILLAGTVLWLVGCLEPGIVLAVGALGCIAAAAMVVTFLRREVHLARPFDWGLLGQGLVYGLKLAAANVLYVLSYNVTVLLLRYLTPERFDDVALYARAVAVCGLVTLVPTAIGPLLYAKWSGMTGQARTDQAEMALRLNVAYGATSMVGVLLLGKYIIWILYGAAFIPAEVTLEFLAPALFFIPIFGVCNNMLVSDGRVMISVCLMAGTLALVTAVTYLAVPALGIRGAALGALCGNAFTAVAAMAACASLYGMNPLRCFLLRRLDVAYVIQSLRRQA
jgi:O-antigen/teichoic acid export membrane protein